jgi:hypothetical protein
VKRYSLITIFSTRQFVFVIYRKSKIKNFIHDQADGKESSEKII